MPRKRMLVHDRRLEGNPPPIAQNTYQPDENTSTSHIVDWVGQYAQQQGSLDDLIIMCHGYALLVGFDGLQLGRENLTITNVIRTSAWKPNIKNIYLYACGPAAESILGDPALDGHRFCGELALWSGAFVYAADAIQWYHKVRTAWQRIWGGNPAGTIDFGQWEGQVYKFSPVDGIGRRVNLGSQPTSR